MTTALFGAISFTVCAAASAAIAQHTSHPVPGQVAPDVYAEHLMQAPDALHTGEISLEQFRGKVVYVKFWSTGCIPCIQAMPGHNALQEKFGDKLVFLGVTSQHPDELHDFLKMRTSSMIVLSDPERRTWWRYYPYGEGTGTLIAADGRVSRVSLSDLKLDEGMIEAALRNEYEPGPPIDWYGNILPHARPIGASWGEYEGRGPVPYGQDPYSLGPESTFQIICRPAAATGRFEMMSQGARSTAVTAPARWIIARHSRMSDPAHSVSGTPSHRIIGPAWLDERHFDFLVSAPDENAERVQAMIWPALEMGMGVRLERATRAMDGYTLVRLDTAPELPVSDAEYPTWLGSQPDGDGGYITKAGGNTCRILTANLERNYRVPIVCGIDDQRAYDFILPSRSEAGTPAQLSDYLEETYGLRLVPGMVEVEVVIVHDGAVAEQPAD